MRKFTNLQVVLIILISLFVGFYFGVNKVTLDWKGYSPQLNVLSKDPPPDTVNVDFTPFWTVWQKLQTDYYDKSKLNQQAMVNGAIQGMVATLGDPFTLYLPPTQNNNFKQGLSGQFDGIGAELTSTNSKVIVLSALDGSPAQKAGIKGGDEIVDINGTSVAGVDLNSIVDKIRGPKGSQVTLTIIPKGQTSPKDVTITRDVIQVKSVTAWVKQIKDIQGVNIAGNPDVSVAYIRLSQFGDDTNKEWSSIMPGLAAQIKSENAKGVILDLRENPGGYLTDATYIASEFLQQGAPVVIEQDETGTQTTLSATRPGLLTTVPLIVLIDRGSASASEIVAGALRDNKRAILVGEKSFGKGTVQQAEDLGNGAGLHVTIAKWLTPNGTWVNGKGLIPDVATTADTKDPSHDTTLESAIEQLLK